MSSPSGAQDNTAQIAYWNDKAAETWTGFQERLDAMFEPLTRLLVDAAAPVLGERVIDVGCGCGATVLALANRVGPTGRILGLDVSETMSARARQRIAAAAISNAEVAVSDAAIHAFSRADTDLLFSRFGVMFFADPVAAFANLRRAMRSGGRLMCAAWRPLGDNPWFSVPLDAARPLLPPQVPADPNAPGPFAFADRERTLRILSGAGWRDTQLIRQDVPIKFAEAGQIDQASEFATRVGALARQLGEASAEVRESIRLAVAEALKIHDGPNGVNLIGSIWLISARA